ncbi:hypothetical protein [Mycolicibacterium goodii]|uniref:hypothetical protein n=1 Tax=Mycolicibacterium goodii TaxID=134601 RepID=UPI001BDD607F|nr:hypothetical protein [Mycolicibacterium goodii]MBU8834536.1 hypothetical protein [Mycolicibacterium goodii]
MGYPEFRVIEEALDWDPAEVTVPPVPDDAVYGPGVDPVGILVNAVMPDIAADVNQQVANTRAREERFAGNLRSARTAYHGTDSAGQAQIDSVASKIDPADAFGAGVPAPPTSAASPTGDAGFSQLTQLMGAAMQGVQQAVQMPMQATGMAAQMVQPVMQGVQGIIQQGTQASGKSQGDIDDEGDGLGSSSGVGPTLEDESRSLVDERQKSGAEEDVKPEDAKKPERESAAAMAGAGEGPQAPVSAPQDEPLHPPRSRRMTGTSPEVAL